MPQPPDPQFADWERLLREPTLHGENTRPAQPSEPVAPYGLGVTLLDTPPGKTSTTGWPQAGGNIDSRVINRFFTI